ncbi:hypothetical protein [Enterobacter bugandensis]|uniref:hypothetical protein n=1 Tax=Enterobacter bugandensis TaxID=881260 RepID=UPI0023609F75|nr:hypothetical protein [Enterobacter bugandensis]
MEAKPAILTFGLFYLYFVFVSSSQAELLPSKIITMPGGVDVLHPGANDSIFAVYSKRNDCPYSASRCFSYTVIEKDDMRASDEWVISDLYTPAALGNGREYTITSPGNELYISGYRMLFGLPADTTKKISRFGMPSEIDGQEPGYINSFVFNEDWSKIFVSMKMNRFMNGVAAIDTRSGQPLWTDNRGQHMNGAVYNPQRQSVSYWGGLSGNYTNYGLSETDGSYLSEGAGSNIHFNGRAIARDKNNIIYGVNAENCIVSKIRLASPDNDLNVLLWHQEAENCQNDYSSEHTTISFDERDSNLIYAGYQNAIYAMHRDTGEIKHKILPPEGAFFKGRIVVNAKTGWRYRLFSDEKGSGVLAFSPDGLRSDVIIRRQNITGYPVVAGDSLYIADGDTVYRYPLNAPSQTDWEAVRSIDSGIVDYDKNDKALKLSWVVKKDGAELERHSIMLDPRDEVNGKTSPHKWPLLLATAINERSLFLKAGEKTTNGIIPLASSYRNLVFIPEGANISVEFEVQEHISNNCPSSQRCSLSQKLKINPTGSYICSYSDMPAGKKIKITVSMKKTDVTKTYTVPQGGEGQYSWPKSLSEFINNEFHEQGIMAGEKISDDKGKVRTLYSKHRNRLWTTNGNQVKVSLSSGFGEIANQCR